jgi:quinol-cytochrome oxidoreductase complex cytochrome b subunit
MNFVRNPLNQIGLFFIVAFIGLTIHAMLTMRQADAFAVILTSFALVIVAMFLFLLAPLYNSNNVIKPK